MTKAIPDVLEYPILSRPFICKQDCQGDQLWYGKAEVVWHGRYTYETWHQSRFDSLGDRGGTVLLLLLYANVMGR